MKRRTHPVVYVIAVAVGVALVELGILSPLEWTASLFNISEGTAAFMILFSGVCGGLVLRKLWVARQREEVQGGNGGQA